MKSRKKAKSRAKAAKPVRKARGDRKTVKQTKPKAVRKGSAPDQLDQFISIAAQGLGLRVEKSWMKPVRANLRVTLDLVAMVAEFPLPDDAEPAPVFRA
jgi:hypothetical protein